VSPSATAVVARARLLGDEESATFFGSFGVAVPGETALRPGTIPNVPLGTLTGDATWPQASDPFDVSIPLPAGVGDVVLDVVAVDLVCGLAPPQAAILLDDLRAE
jgi:hypothetical protein